MTNEPKFYIVNDVPSLIFNSIQNKYNLDLHTRKYFSIKLDMLTNIINESDFILNV